MPNVNSKKKKTNKGSSKAKDKTNLYRDFLDGLTIEENALNDVAKNAKYM